jgi:hypothetical protein
MKTSSQRPSNSSRVDHSITIDILTRAVIARRPIARKSIASAITQD